MRPVFNPAVMYYKYGGSSAYSTPQIQPAPFAAHFPSLYFYSRLFSGPFLWLRSLALRNQCDDIAWIYGSSWVGDIFEDCGGTIFLEGLENLDAIKEPCVFVSNHMSTLETFLLPAILRPAGRLTFIVKKSLVEMPFFGPIMRSRQPVAVERKNPREDLAIMLEEGTKRMKSGCSIVVFPQSTRSIHFSREHFNSIGIKLARRANAKIIPIALKTDAWGQGALFRDLGKIHPEFPVRIKIGNLLEISGNGKKEHAEICEFIESSLENWQKNDGVNK